VLCRRSAIALLPGIVVNFVRRQPWSWESERGALHPWFLKMSAKKWFS